MPINDYFPLDQDYFSGGSFLTPGRDPATGFDRAGLRTLLNELGSRPTYTTLDDDYTIDADDELQVLEADPTAAGGSMTITLPADFTQGFVCTIRQVTAGTVTIAAGVGATVNRVATAASPITLAEQWATATLEVRAEDSWIVVGQLTAA